MSFNGGFNPFRKRDAAAERPKNATESLRQVLDALDSRYGKEQVAEALGHLRGTGSAGELRLRNLPPVSDDLIKEVEKLQGQVGDKGEVLAALIELDDERDADFLAGSAFDTVDNPIDTESADARFAAFLPKAEDIAMRDAASISEAQLNALIEESSSIELHPKNAAIYSALVTLRSVLFMPGANHAGATFEGAMRSLRKAVGAA